MESFANKHVSSSEDRLEETKRRKLARKCEKLVELMMVSGVPTASGYEERIQFSEMEIVERGAQDSGLLANMPEGNSIHGWDVNVAAVRTTSVKRTVRYHQHAVSFMVLLMVFCCWAFLLTTSVVGIHRSSSSPRQAGDSYWEEIWRVCQASQETEDRAARETTPSSSS